MAKTEGLYDEGVSDIKGSSVTCLTEPAAVYIDPVSQLTTYRNDLVVDRGIVFKEAQHLLELECTTGDASGFYRSRNQNFGSYLYLLAIQKQEKKSAFKLYRPNTGASAVELTEDQLHGYYVKIDDDAAEAGWREKYEQSLHSCIHGSDCRLGDRCQVHLTYDGSP